MSSKGRDLRGRRKERLSGEECAVGNSSVPGATGGVIRHGARGAKKMVTPGLRPRTVSLPTDKAMAVWRVERQRKESCWAIAGNAADEKAAG